MIGNDRMIYRRGASQSATFVVAASDSLHQGYADYVCDGVDDQVEIQAAIDALPSKDGYQYDSFDAQGSWTPEYDTTISVDADDKVEGTGSLKLVTSTNYLAIHKDVSDLDLSDYKEITLSLKTDTIGTDKVALVLTDTSDVNGYLMVDTYNTRWITQPFQLDRFVNDVPDLEHIKKIRFVFYTTDTAEAHVDDLRFLKEGEGSMGKIEFMEGTYNISDPIIAKSGVYEGCGEGTHFVSSSDFGPIFQVEHRHDVMIKNICVDGADINPTATKIGLINLLDSTNVDVSGVLALNSRMIGIRANNCKNLRIAGCTVNHSSTTQRSGIRVCESDHCIVINNILYGVNASIGLCCPRDYTVSNNKIYDSSYSRGAIWLGTYYRDSYNVLIKDNIITSTGPGICLIGNGGGGYNLSRVRIEGNIIDSSDAGIDNDEMSIAPSDSVLTSIKLNNNIIVNAATGIKIGNYGTIDINVFDNIFESCSVPVNISAGVTTDIWRNKGYVTENSGTATIVSGTTSIVVDHGLDVTPSAGDIMVTPMGSLGSASYFYIDTFTSTQFTIHTNADPGANVDFAWKAIVL